MAKSLAEIFGSINKLGTTETVKTGIPDVLPPSFTAVSRRVIGRTVSYGKSTGQRKFAQQNQYGAPAKQVQVNGVSEVAVNMIHSFDTHTHNPLLLQNIMRQDNDQVQALAIDELTRQIAYFKARYQNTRIGAAALALANGKIWLDGEGNLMFADSSPVVTVDYGVPSANKDQIGGIIGASWAVESTDIIEDIQAIKRQAIKTTGLPIRHAFYGANIAQYVANNNRASSLISSNPSLQNQFWNTGTLPSGFCDIMWHDAALAFGLNSSASVTDIFGADTIVFTPEPSTEWWETVEGSFLVPGGLGVVAMDANGQLANLNTVYGQFSYATLTHNPATIQQFGGDTFLPIIKNGSAVFIADVTPS